MAVAAGVAALVVRGDVWATTLGARLWNFSRAPLIDALPPVCRAAEVTRHTRVAGENPAFDGGARTLTGSVRPAVRKPHGRMTE